MENLVQNQEIQDKNQIADNEELNYWSKEFGIAKEELLAVVKRGGTFAAAVESYVKRIKLAV